MEEKLTGLAELGRRIGLIFLLAGLLVACAVSGDGPETPVILESLPVSEAGTSTLPEQVLTDDLVFDILLAEIAGQRGSMEESVAHYLQAAEAARDPRVARRAVQIATFAKQYSDAVRAAQRWVELDPDDLDAHKALTALALQNNDREQVVAQLDYLLTTSDDPEEGYRLATSVLARDPNKDNALAAMQQLVAHHPDSPYALLALSRIAVSGNHLEEALAAVDRALQQSPDLPEALILKAQILVRLERKEAATELLANAIKRHPENPGMHFAYGRMLLDAEDLEAAKKQFGTVVRLAPDNAEGLYSLALLELETGQYKLGEKHLKQLLVLKKGEQNAYYYLGYAALKQKKDEAALEWYGNVQSGEYWSQAQLRTAEILVRLGRVDAMQDHMRVLRQKNPEEIVTFYLIEGQVLSEAGHYQTALDVYETALEPSPDNEDLLYAYSLVAEKLGKLEIAERSMRRILLNDPDNVRTLNALGYTLADRTDRYEEALTYINKAYSHEPDDPAIIDSLGWVHYRLGNLDEARRYLQQAWEITRDSEIGAHLGEVMWVQGEREAARKIWEASREAAPDNPVLLKVMDRYDQ